MKAFWTGFEKRAYKPGRPLTKKELLARVLIAGTMGAIPGATIGAIGGGERDKATGKKTGRLKGALRGAVAGGAAGAITPTAMWPLITPMATTGTTLAGLGLIGASGGAGYYGAKKLGPKYKKEHEENLQKTLRKAEKIKGQIGLQKQAKVRVGDIEDRLGVYLPDSLEEKARGMIADETARSLGIRHPWLTGIPTLGLWPAIAHENAISRISRKLPRSDEGLRQDIAAVRNQRHQREVDLQQLRIAQEQAEAKKEVASTATTAALAGLGAYLASKEKQNSISQEV